ncbi:hypothetical protein RRG08_001724 [Elysia crispata]|uniref:Uncharacterized protein n=1 Tax=Elysia crispata TaxID=231223 RepID=A0AAE1ALG4_9GAST|nr:hypothetical protein RRG08_001724 [Elysia crispata]
MYLLTTHPQQKAKNSSRFQGKVFQLTTQTRSIGYGQCESGCYFGHAFIELKTPGSVIRDAADVSRDLNKQDSQLSGVSRQARVPVVVVNRTPVLHSLKTPDQVPSCSHCLTGPGTTDKRQSAQISTSVCTECAINIDVLDFATLFVWGAADIIYSASFHKIDV